MDKKLADSYRAMVILFGLQIIIKKLFLKKI